MLAPWPVVQRSSLEKVVSIFFATFLKFKTIISDDVYFMNLWAQISKVRGLCIVDLEMNSSFHHCSMKGLLEALPNFEPAKVFRHLKPLKFNPKKLQVFFSFNMESVRIFGWEDLSWKHMFRMFLCQSCFVPLYIALSLITIPCDNTCINEQ